MKSLKSKVILSAAVLLFALVATIGSTYAWFTVSNTVTVSSIQMNVQTSESLLIKVDTGEAYNAATLLDAENYKANLTQTDVTASSLYTNLSTWKLSPVTSQQTNMTTTSINGAALNSMNVDTRAYTSAATGNSSTGTYIEINFWVLSQGTADANIALQDLTITASNSLTAQDAVVDAVKVAAWTSRVYGVAVDAPETAKVFGLDNDWGFVFTSGMRGYVGDSTDSIDGTTKTALQALQSVYYQSGATAADNIVTDTLSAATTISTLSTNVPERITVRFYVEGWDAECTNAVLAAQFSISFKFTIKA